MYLLGMSDCALFEGETPRSENVVSLNRHGAFNVFMHMDYLKNKEKSNSVLGRMHTRLLSFHYPVCQCVCVCVLHAALFARAHRTAGYFTGCSRADAVFIESWPLAVQAAMSRTLALQRANL